MPNQRTRYRVKPRPQDQLRAVVISTSGGAALGEILDISSGGIGMSFDRQPLPVFPLRTRVEVRLSSPELSEPLAITATVCRRSERDPVRVYGFSFDATQARAAASAPGLGRLFNKRSAHRVRPDPDELNDAIIQGTLPPSKIPGTIRDISQTGVSIEAMNDLSAILTRGETVRLTLGLGKQTGRLVLDGRVIRRETLGATILYGIVFGGPRALGFAKKLEALSSYIADRTRNLAAERKKPDQNRSVSSRP